MANATEHHRYSVVDNIAGPDGGYDYISVDPDLQRVFVGRSYDVMAIDLATHKVIPALIKENDVAAVLIVPGTDLMLSTNNGDNTAMTIFQLDTSGKATVLDTITTRKGARTAALHPENGRLYLPSRQYRYDDDGDRSAVPGSFSVTVVAPGQ